VRPVAPYCVGAEDLASRRSQCRYLKRFRDEEGVLFIGKAQEKTPVFRIQRRCNVKTGPTYSWLVRAKAGEPFLCLEALVLAG